MINGVSDVTLGKALRLRDEIASWLLASVDYSRSDTLFPAHYRVFGTNPLSVAYGAVGIAFFLKSVHGELPIALSSWLGHHPVSESDYPPGLYVGMAGIAYSLCELGFRDRAIEIMDICYRSPLLNVDPTMYDGAAGWGLASMYFYRQTGDQRYIEKVVQAAEYLLRAASPHGGGLYWRYTMDRRIHYGYGYGSSGIALFLLEAGLLLDRADLVGAAIRGLRFDLECRIETRYGWGWPAHEDDLGRASPYFSFGAAGVGVTAIRFARRFPQDEDYQRIAETIADSVSVDWTFFPSMSIGLSGIADFLLDMSLTIDDEGYGRRISRMLDMLAVYAIPRATGVAFPGPALDRLCSDYATGAAGVGIFLTRLLAPGPKFLVDLGADW